MKVAWEVLMNVVKKITSSSVFWYVFFAGVAYYAYKRLTKPKNETFLDTPLPNSGSGIPQGWKADDLALKFHDYFDSYFNWLNADTIGKLYVAANELTNDQFVTLVKTYNAKYAKLDGDTTLWKRVTGWKTFDFGLWSTERDTFRNRMISLKQDY